jgi:hypothetical protein
LDFKKAYDTVWREAAFVKLHRAGVRGRTWRLLWSMYSNTSSGLPDMEGSLPCRWPDREGVRQGALLSPLIFNIFINDLWSSIQEACPGCHIPGSDLFWGQMYADDVVLVADSPASLQLMLDAASA